MFELFEKKNLKEETAIIFSLESGQVLSGILALNKNKPPRYLYTHKEALKFQHNLEPSRLQSMMLSSLKISAERLLKEGLLEAKGKMPGGKKVYVFLGSPWHFTISADAIISKPEAFIIEENLIEKTAKEQFGLSHEDLLPLEQKIISVKANGYKLQDPVGKKAKTIDIFSFVSAAPKKLILDIEEILHLSFPKTKFDYHTNLQTFFPIAEGLAHKSDFLMFIPEHEISELVLAKDNCLEANISIPFGKHTPLRALASIFKKEKASSASLLALYLRGELEEKKKAEVEELLKESKKKFQESLKEALWNLASTPYIPQDVIICDDQGISRLLGEWIKSEEWNTGAKSSGFSVYFISNSDLEKNIESEGTVKYMSTLLISVALYLKAL